MDPTQLRIIPTGQRCACGQHARGAVHRIDAVDRRD
jgi:hypothetical protein